MGTSRILGKPAAINGVSVRGRKVRDLTQIETVYVRTFSTILLKVNRLDMSREPLRLRISVPADLIEVLHAIYALYDDDQEHLVMLVLNGGGDVTGYKLISTGAQDYTIGDPRVIYRNALMLGAAAIIIVHNHPSGDITPSAADMDMTRQLARAGELMNVELLDHIIYSPKNQLSFKQAMPSLFTTA
ncbi:MAG TPA: JAB domain-containing protein [Candidatus Kapabacteria bacterium]|nr:JAB domain-containing protein [Candidatus Kapabacteria bacterium]